MSKPNSLVNKEDLPIPVALSLIWSSGVLTPEHPSITELKWKFTSVVHVRLSVWQNEPNKVSNLFGTKATIPFSTYQTRAIPSYYLLSKFVNILSLHARACQPLNLKIYLLISILPPCENWISLCVCSNHYVSVPVRQCNGLAAFGAEYCQYVPSYWSLVVWLTMPNSFCLRFLLLASWSRPFLLPSL